MRERIILVYVDANLIKVVAVVVIDAPVRAVVIVDGPPSVSSVDDGPTVFARFGRVDSFRVDEEVGVATQPSPGLRCCRR